MKKLIKFIMVSVLLGCSLVYAGPTAGEPGDVSARLRLYEGFRQVADAPAKVISSYYLKPLPQKETVSEVGIQKEITSLKRVFNMERIKLVTDAAFSMKKGSTKNPLQVVVLNGRNLLLQVSPVNTRRNRFKVEVFEVGKSKKSLFRSTVVLPQKKTTALGFEDSNGKIYFLSFQRSKDQPVLQKTSANPAGTGKPAVVNKEKRNAVTVTDPKKRPRLLKRVQPVYPKVALKSKISGKVVMEATIDIYGHVVAAVVTEGPELLKEPSINAIRQWKYEPFIADGKPAPVTFTVVMTYRLQQESKNDEPINLSSIKAPKLIKKVASKYPVDAVKKKITGTVVLEAVTDKEGNVSDAKIMSGHPQLRRAAIESVKQWKYEPYIKNGEKRRVRFTVVLIFKLDEPITLDADNIPELIKKIEPEYPRVAKKAHVQGTVVLEAVTDKEGNVKKTKVLSGHPLLRKAAETALKQWKYEPYIQDDQKRAVRFIVVIRYNPGPQGIDNGYKLKRQFDQ